MIFKHSRGAISVLAAAWYSGSALAAGYNTQIYSVTADIPNGLLYIDGVDLAPAAGAGGAHVQLLGQALSINEAGSSSTHLEVALPATLSLYPGTGYQLYVSPNRAQAGGGSSQADQAYFTLYPSTRLGVGAVAEAGKATGNTAASGSSTSSSSASGSASAAGTTTIKTVAGTTGLAGAAGRTGATGASGNSVSNGPVAHDGATFTLPYTGGLNSSSSLFSVTNAGAGAALDGFNTSTSANAYAVRGTLTSTTPGNGSAAVRGVNNSTSSTAYGVYGSQAGSGIGVYGTSPAGTGIYGLAQGVGQGVHGRTSGSGQGVYADSIGTGTAFYATSATAPVAQFVNTSATSTYDLATISNAGKGRGLYVNESNTSSTANALEVVTVSPGVIAGNSPTGNAGNFFNNNTSGVGAGVRGEVNSIFGNGGTAGIHGVASGTGGYGGYFEHTNASGFGMALYATTAGQGVVSHFETPSNAGSSNGNSQTTLEVVTAGTGNGETIANTNSSSTANTLNVTSNGPGVIADHSTGNAGNFFMNNTSGVGAGVRGEVNSIFGNNGTAGVYGTASGTGGYGGYFEHNETTGYGIALQAISYGKGTVMVVDGEGTNTDLATFQSGGGNKARIDATGKGFFDGGTQNSGADLAEFVPVSGAIPQVGDVVEIDPEHPDSFRLCAEANTTRVAGIISTAPGVTLNARNGATQDVSGPALALAGRVPTKVNDKGGAIHIGDLLVASSEPGRAMRAPARPEPGTVIGKALQDSDEAEDTVQVLVMLR